MAEAAMIAIAQPDADKRDDNASDMTHNVICLHRLCCGLQDRIVQLELKFLDKKREDDATFMMIFDNVTWQEEVSERLAALERQVQKTTDEFRN